MDITNLGQSSKNDFTNNQGAGKNIIRKLELQHQKQKQKQKLGQCCLDIASRNITIDQSIKEGCKSTNVVEAIKKGDIAYLDKFLTEKPPHIINEPYGYGKGEYTLLYIAVVNH